MTGTCRYKYVQGPNKGIMCKKPCRDGDRCKMHKKTNIDRRKEYYKETKGVIYRDKIAQIKTCTDINELPSINELVQKKELYFTSYVFKTKKLIGYKLEQGINQDAEIKNLKELVKGKCICPSNYEIDKDELEAYRDEMYSIYLGNNNFNPTHTFHNKFDPKGEDEEVYLFDMTDEQLSTVITHRHRCSKCDNFNNDNCRYCNSGYIPYFECTEKIDDNKVSALEKKISILYKKMEQKKKIIIAVKEAINKLKNIK